MPKSKQNRITKLAFKKGYRVTGCGKHVISPRGTNLKLSLQCKRGKLYYSFSLRPEKGANSTRLYVHKLQAYQKFKKKMFKEGILVRHLNDISTDNSRENIDIGTHIDNIMDRLVNVDDCPF